ncbi:MAG: hypothetical protein H0A75_01015 [Candidatus Methanofishera endochildressiae]|uniref:Uncharacterized protein n=1 Tax=Candidatus Methanofishera endochildressiae TaxID=2738884 RepID=A0A7Z0MMV3_9GAMM|nr:hypothetical protein [Candidatus Methanofishera endochildressiae]
MRNIISTQLEIGQVDIANIVIDVTSRDDSPLILLGLQHIYTTESLKEAVFSIFRRAIKPPRNNANTVAVDRK